MRCKREGKRDIQTEVQGHYYADLYTGVRRIVSPTGNGNDVVRIQTSGSKRADASGRQRERNEVGGADEG